MSVTVGSRNRATVTFKVGTTPTDPTAVTAKVLSPDGLLVASYVYGSDNELVKDSTGVYHVDVDVNDPGPWTVRFQGTGAVVAADEVTIDVVASPFYPND